MWFFVNFETRIEHDCLMCQDSAHNIIALRGLRAQPLFTKSKSPQTHRLFSRQVSSKARHSSNNHAPRIDVALRWRYSQPQIPDLVANANPRFPQTAQSFGSAMRQAGCFPQKSVNSLLGRHGGDASSRVFASNLAEVADRTPAADILINAAPVPAASGNRFTSTHTRPTGGPRFL
jgi:hypothetical protein